MLIKLKYTSLGMDIVESGIDTTVIKQNSKRININKLMALPSILEVPFPQEKWSRNSLHFPCLIHVHTVLIILLTEICRDKCHVVDSIVWAQEREMWRVYLKVIIDVQGPCSCGNLLSSWWTASFSITINRSLISKSYCITWNKAGTDSWIVRYLKWNIGTLILFPTAVFS